MKFHRTKYFKTGDCLNCIKSSFYLIEKSQFRSEERIGRHKEISPQYDDNHTERVNTLNTEHVKVLNIAAGDSYS